MAVQKVHTITNYATTVATDLLLIVPSDAQIGDLLVAQLGVTSTSSNSWTAPAGWTQVLNYGSTTEDTWLGVFYKWHTTTNEQITFNCTTAGYRTGQLHVFRGVDTANPISLTSYVSVRSAVSVKAPDITNAISGNYAICLLSVKGVSAYIVNDRGTRYHSRYPIYALDTGNTTESASLPISVNGTLTGATFTDTQGDKFGFCCTTININQSTLYTGLASIVNTNSISTNGRIQYSGLAYLVTSSNLTATDAYRYGQANIINQSSLACIFKHIVTHKANISIVNNSYVSAIPKLIDVSNINLLSQNHAVTLSPATYIQISPPSDVYSGKLLILLVSARSTSATTPIVMPSGWTLIFNTGIDPVDTFIAGFYKWAGTSETAVTINLTGGADAVAYYLNFDGAKYPNPIGTKTTITYAYSHTIISSGHMLTEDVLDKRISVLGGKVEEYPVLNCTSGAEEYSIAALKNALGYCMYNPNPDIYYTNWSSNIYISMVALDFFIKNGIKPNKALLVSNSSAIATGIASIMSFGKSSIVASTFITAKGIIYLDNPLILHNISSFKVYQSIEFWIYDRKVLQKIIRNESQVTFTGTFYEYSQEVFGILSIINTSSITIIGSKFIQYKTIANIINTSSLAIIGSKFNTKGKCSIINTSSIYIPYKTYTAMQIILDYLEEQIALLPPPQVFINGDFLLPEDIKPFINKEQANV